MNENIFFKEIYNGKIGHLLAFRKHSEYISLTIVLPHQHLDTFMLLAMHNQHIFFISRYALKPNIRLKILICFSYF